jgi:hypothetical protein
VLKVSFANDLLFWTMSGVQHLLEFEDKKFVDVSKDELKMNDKDAAQQKKQDKVCIRITASFERPHHACPFFFPAAFSH